MAIELLGPNQIERMRAAGRAAAQTLAHVGARIRPGVRADEIDAWVREHTARQGGRPSQLGFHGFPAAVCVSPNEVVCHGIPTAQVILRDGDIVNVDVTTELDGIHGDTSITFLVGEVRPEVRRLVDTTKAALEAGIEDVAAAEVLLAPLLASPEDWLRGMNTRYASALRMGDTGI